MITTSVKFLKISKITFFNSEYYLKHFMSLLSNFGFLLSVKELEFVYNRGGK